MPICIGNKKIKSLNDKVLLIALADDLNWNQRMQLALAIARVLEYLQCHNPLYQLRFVHPALIMLDQVGHLWFYSCSR